MLHLITFHNITLLIDVHKIVESIKTMKKIDKHS